MAGRPKTPMYEYTREGNFVKKYESKQEVFDLYYEGKKRPLCNARKFNFAELPNDNLLFEKRIYRDDIVNLLKALSSKFVTNEKSEPIAAYNLLGEKVASFRSLYMASLITGIPISTIRNHLMPNKKFRKHTRTVELLFKYEIDGRLKENT